LYLVIISVVQVGFDDSGKLNAIVMTAYCDCGFTKNGFSGAVELFIDNGKN
jgi:xanthine dehydrogenase molybdopterin-binding subunit B